MCEKCDAAQMPPNQSNERGTDSIKALDKSPPRDQQHEQEEHIEGQWGREEVDSACKVMANRVRKG